MNIVLISNTYPPYIRGGAEIIAQRMSEGLRDYLQHVTVITTRPYAGLKSLGVEKITINDVPTIRFYPLNLYHYLNDYKYPALVRFLWHFIDIFNIHSAVILYRQLKQLRPDVVITHNIMGIGFLTPRVISLLKIKHMHVLHDVQLYNPSGIIIHGKEDTPTQRLANVLQYPALMRRLFRACDMIISPSHFLLNFYTSKGYFTYSEKHVLRNPTLRIDIERREHMSRQSMRLLYLGQLTDPKGIDGLIKVVRRLVNLDIELKVVGQGPLLKKLSRSAQKDKRIAFLGWINRDMLESIFSDTDILVVPTLCYDNSPTVIYEALANEVPVLAAEIGGIPEIITDGKNGWLFKPGDWTDLQRRISYLYDHRELIKQAGLNTSDSLEGISLENYIQSILTVCDTSTPKQPY